MINKHYLLSKFRYVAKDKERFKGLSHEEIIEYEYKNRIESSSAIIINFNIHPFSKTKQIRLLDEKYPLFFMLLPEHLAMIQEINNKSKQIAERLDLLPAAAKEKISFSHLVTEIKSSNDIEGVKSTRKELEDAINARNTSKDLRFKSTIKQYLRTLYSEKPYIYDLKEIWKLYDNIVLEEIEKENYPDGRLFRKNEVSISNLLYGEKVHVGDSNEEEITEDLTKLLSYMNEEDESYIIKAIVSHYIFEYIHPFYDGNGRLGRYLLSSYLAYKLDPFSALSISEAIKNNKNKYGDIFSEVTYFWLRILWNRCENKIDDKLFYNFWFQVNLQCCTINNSL